MNKKLAPELRARLRSAGDDRSLVPPFEAKAKSERARVGIIVEFNGNMEDLTAVEFEQHTLVQHPTKGYKVATGIISLDRLEDLAAIDHVIEIEGPRRMFPELDYSLSEIRATYVHEDTPSRKGDGIVIGVIDSGIEWKHGSFIKDDGTSRILAIWDQTLDIREVQLGDTVGPNGEGIVFHREEISKALQGKRSILTKDYSAISHGTHVAGIAAGNGRPASCCHGSGTYIGVAPNADLIAVHLKGSSEIGENTRLVDAMSFIQTRASSERRSTVINISQGDNLGPHDGTSLVERTIDALVAYGDLVGPRLIIVKSAGNEGDEEHHAEGSVVMNTTFEVEFLVEEGEKEVVMDLWYDRAGTLNLIVIDPTGRSIGPINHGSDFPKKDIGGGSFVDVDATINGKYDRNNNFRITINPSKGSALASHPWKLNLKNPNLTPVYFHCWIQRDTGARFPIATPASTITTPGTAGQVITVANHESRTDWCDCWPSTRIVASSSRGPLVRGPATNQKPEIAAPGLSITAPKADALNLSGNYCSCCPDACCCLYRDLTGTSMAAPHVAGAIALLLEENSQLTRAEIVGHLQATARDKPALGWDPTWGAGKLDVEAAIKAVRGGARGGGSPLLHPQIISDPSLNNRSCDPRQLHFTPGTELTRGRVKDSDYLPQAFPSWFQIVREKLKALPEGEHIAATLSRHFSEVRRLINTNRRVATMWHRAEGPRLLRRLLHGSLDANALASNKRDTATRYLGRCFDLLAHHGSPRLRESMERYRSLFIALLAIPNCIPTNSTTSEGA